MAMTPYQHKATSQGTTILKLHWIGPTNERAWKGEMWITNIISDYISKTDEVHETSTHEAS